MEPSTHSLTLQVVANHGQHGPGRMAWLLVCDASLVAHCDDRASLMNDLTRLKREAFLRVTCEVVSMRAHRDAVQILASALDDQSAASRPLSQDDRDTIGELAGAVNRLEDRVTELEAAA